MSIPVKSAAEIAVMRDACRIAATVLERLCRMVEPGINTYDLDQEGRRLMAGFGAASACYDYRAGTRRFPAFTCLSLNDEVVHGIGDLRKVVREGDILTVDVCVLYNGFIGDNARTVPVGAVDPSVQQLLRATETALFAGLAEARPGNRVGFISNAIERSIAPHRYGIIRDFVGHGVGRTMHEPPQIPNFGPRKSGDRLRPGMTLAIEPMITMRSPKVRIDDDGWTARTLDGAPSAHFEHTVLVTPDGPEILTIPEGADPAEAFRTHP